MSKAIVYFEQQDVDWIVPIVFRDPDKILKYETDELGFQTFEHCSVDGDWYEEVDMGDGTYELVYRQEPITQGWYEADYGWEMKSESWELSHIQWPECYINDIKKVKHQWYWSALLKLSHYSDIFKQSFIPDEFEED